MSQLSAAMVLGKNENLAGHAKYIKSSDGVSLIQTAMTTQTLDPLALDQLRPFKGHDGGSLLGNLIQVYLDQLPGRVEGLLKAYQEGDVHSVFKIAHMLKSTSASLGAYALQNLCQRFEDSSREEDLSGIESLLAVFEAETSKVKTALLDEQQKLGAAPK